MTSPNKSGGKKRSNLRLLGKLALLGLVAGAIYFAASRTTSSVSDSQTFVLRRGTLPITVTANGGVKSLAPRHIRAEIRERGVKILSIVEEGRRITKEDIDNKLVLVELDSSGMEDNIMRDELDYESAVAECSRAEQDIEILRKENESDIQDAERDVKFKAMDFKKYIGEVLANEVINRLEFERTAINALEDLQRTAREYDSMQSEVNNLMKRARDKRAQTSPTIVADGDAEEEAPEMDMGAVESDSALALIASAAGALLGDSMNESAFGGMERYGLERDSRSPEELEATAKNIAESAEKAKLRLAASKAEFLEAVAAVGLNQEDFTGDPGTWSVEFEKVDFSELGKDPRLGGAAARQRESLLTDIMLDEEDLLMAKNTLEGSEELFASDFIPETELEKERLGYERKKRALKLKRETERLFFAYDFPKLAEQAYADYEEALRVLERTRATALTKQAAAEVELTSSRKRLAYHEEEIRENEELIHNYTIYAETEGLVVYGDPGGSSRYFNTDLIKEGAEVREGMTLLTIPDITQMAVQVKIPEAAIKKIKTGLKARIFVEAFPTEDVVGEVIKVAVLPSSSSRYMNPDLKLYETTVDVVGIHEWLKPGMTAQVEIYVDQLDDVLYVPRQAVTTHGSDRIVYLASGERRVVETGQFNENYIEIVSGLEEGDEVILDLRPFKGEIEDTVDNEKPEEDGAAPRAKAPAKAKQRKQGKENT